MAQGKKDLFSRLNQTELQAKIRLNIFSEEALNEEAIIQVELQVEQHLNRLPIFWGIDPPTMVGIRVHLEGKRSDYDTE